MTALDVRVATPSLSEHEAEAHDGMWIRTLDAGEAGEAGRGSAHRHHQHRIVWCSHGETTARVGDREWALSTTQAIWIPSGTPYELEAERPSSLHCLSVAPEDCPIDWREPVVLAITPMLRELLLTLRASDRESRVSEAATAFLFSLLRPRSEMPLQLPLPTDYRALALAQAVLARPGDRRTLDEWADRFETRAGTLRRAFVNETGLTFREWRTQSRLRAALVLLADHVLVETVACKVGYDSTDEFVDAFRRHFGHTPGGLLSRVPA